METSKSTKSIAIKNLKIGKQYIATIKSEENETCIVTVLAKNDVALVCYIGSDIPTHFIGKTSMQYYLNSEWYNEVDETLADIYDEQVVIYSIDNETEVIANSEYVITFNNLKKQQSESKLQKVAMEPENVKHNIRKGLKLNASAKTIQKQFEKMEELLLELKPKMQKLHGKTVAIDNKAVPGGWAKIEFDETNNILKCTATNSKDKEPRYISIFEYEMLHNAGLKQYKEWKLYQSVSKEVKANTGLEIEFINADTAGFNDETAQIFETLQSKF